MHKVHQEVYSPAVTFGKQYYDAYGAPKVEQARKFGQQNWENVLKPQVDTAQYEAKKQYDSNLAPHVDKASAAAAPYVAASRDNAYQVYKKHILPTYGSLRPRVEKAYAYLHGLMFETGFPYARSVWSSALVFFDRILWPKIRILYGENVEPQLVRIGERLGRYRDGRKMQAAMDDLNSSSQLSSDSSTSVSDSVVSATTTTSATSVSPQTHLTPEQEVERARAKIESDLKDWQEKFTRAADKGIEDLQDRVKEITDRQVKSHVGGTGEALAIQLEETVSSQEADLKKRTNEFVRSLPEVVATKDMETAEDNLSKATRSAGLLIKDKAQALRSWKDIYDHETRSLISAALNSTLEVIENIRDLGLQEIGMKWAHMEEVTYKDWSRYHELKKSFDEWHKKVEAVVHNHPGLRKSKDASEELEARGMAIAEQAAKELSRLKGVGKWKLQTRDVSDDFSTRYIPAAAVAGAQKVINKLSEASEQAIGTSQGTAESIISQASENAAGVASNPSSKMMGTEPGAAKEAASKISEALSEATEAVVSMSRSAQKDPVSAAKDNVSQIREDASEAAIGTSEVAINGAALHPSGTADSVSAARSEKVAGSSTPLAESAASKAPKKMYGGAMAQEVKEQKPIIDDIFDEDASYSEKLQKMGDHAGEKYADITQAVSEAIIGAPKTQGTVESASSVADERYSKALAAASSVLYGTEQGTAESITSKASDKWAEAVAA